MCLTSRIFEQAVCWRNRLLCGHFEVSRRGLTRWSQGRCCRLARYPTKTTTRYPRGFDAVVSRAMLPLGALHNENNSTLPSPESYGKVPPVFTVRPDPQTPRCCRPRPLAPRLEVGPTQSTRRSLPTMHLSQSTRRPSCCRSTCCPTSTPATLCNG